eukprot:s1854_g7.t1
MRVQEVGGEHERLVESFDLSDNDEENQNQRIAAPSSICAFPWRLAAIMVVCVVAACSVALTVGEHMEGRPGDNFKNNIIAASFSPLSVKKALWDWKLRKAMAKGKAPESDQLGEYVPATFFGCACPKVQLREDDLPQVLCSPPCLCRELPQEEVRPQQPAPPKEEAEVSDLELGASFEAQVELLGPTSG